MAKAFVVTDVHSYYDEMMTALNSAGFDINNDSHILISLGDLLDRGPDAIKCLDFVNNLPDNRKILIRGNHEDLMEEAICRGFFASHDVHNRTTDTAEQITGLSLADTSDDDILTAVKNNERYDKYFKSTVDYYETAKQIFVHGWIPTGFRTIDSERYKDLPEIYRPTEPCYDEDWRNGNWIEARWANGMKMWYNGIMEPGKTIYCGHYHVSWGHAYLHNKGVEWPDEFAAIGVEKGCLPEEANHMHTEPFVGKGIIALDACTALSGVVNCKVIGNFKKLD